ncbi:hypothetical protein [Novosphingobium mathurense]|uniref:Uncharacterized protein n=1 Tax=Novosphingobium mathurense TaxID=428990 RepID=A0A1U6GTL6_9SPHN|nr:hypothetical protein [Novosphingobium mathurense]SLJ86862.1 hypothetical protein SAMN06295987_101390 [Novosphingobium mathurense]
MDRRIGSLIRDLTRSPKLSPGAARKRIWGLVDKVQGEEDMVALMRAYDVVMGIAIDHLERMGQDVQTLRKLMSADRQSFALVEAMRDGAGIEPRTLCRIVDREAAAGRMTRSEELLTLDAAARNLSPRQRAAGRAVGLK